MRRDLLENYRLQSSNIAFTNVDVEEGNACGRGVNTLESAPTGGPQAPCRKTASYIPDDISGGASNTMNRLVDPAVLLIHSHPA